MKWQMRAHTPGVFRPKPILHQQEDLGLFLAIQSWGNPADSQIVIEDVTRYIQAAVADVEVTSPFEFSVHWPDAVNFVRTALMICNENIFYKYNQGEYLSGLEVMVLYRHKNICAWSSVGAHQLMGFTNDKIEIIAASNDSSQASPLPLNMLGVHKTAAIQSGYFLVGKFKNILLTSPNIDVTGAAVDSAKSVDFVRLSHSLIQKNKNEAFFHCLLSF
ncbi:MAG: hypothetical protein ACOYOK_02480 [Pseudobdellovibrionaceae bacterium]